MTDRYDELSERARWFLNNFDEIDLADICANNETAATKAQEALARVRELADRWDNALAPDRSYARTLRAALDEPTPGPAATQATEEQ
jgi:hypothetical protein